MRHGRDALDAVACLKILSMCDLWQAFVDFLCGNIMFNYGFEIRNYTPFCFRVHVLVWDSDWLSPVGDSFFRV